MISHVSEEGKCVEKLWNVGKISTPVRDQLCGILHLVVLQEIANASQEYAL